MVPSAALQADLSPLNRLVDRIQEMENFYAFPSDVVIRDKNN